MKSNTIQNAVFALLAGAVTLSATGCGTAGLPAAKLVTTALADRPAPGLVLPSDEVLAEAKAQKRYDLAFVGPNAVGVGVKTCRTEYYALLAHVMNFRNAANGAFPPNVRVAFPVDGVPHEALVQPRPDGTRLFSLWRAGVQVAGALYGGPGLWQGVAAFRPVLPGSPAYGAVAQVRFDLQAGTAVHDQLVAQPDRAIRTHAEYGVAPGLLPNGQAVPMQRMTAMRYTRFANGVEDKTAFGLTVQPDGRAAAIGGTACLETRGTFQWLGSPAGTGKLNPLDANYNPIPAWPGIERNVPADDTVLRYFLPAAPQPEQAFAFPR